MLVQLTGRAGTADMEAIKDGVIAAGAASGEGGMMGRPSIEKWPKFGVIVSALEIPYSLTFKGSWDDFDARGETTKAVARTRVGLQWVRETRPDWWICVARQGRCVSLVSGLDTAPVRQWVATEDCGGGKLVIYGSYSVPWFPHGTERSLSQIIETLVHAQF